MALVSFHSINVPSEWGLKLYKGLPLNVEDCFHSINVPSEWGLLNKENCIATSEFPFPFN